MITNVRYHKETRTLKDGTEQTNTLGIYAEFDGVEIWVPIDEANRHYQAILEWVAEGNTITDNGGSE